MEKRYSAEQLREFGADLLKAAGLSSDRAQVVAEILLEGDLFGHTTHGFQLLDPYLKSLEAGNMKRHGEPAVVQDRGGTIVWDGDYLPGPWLVSKGMDLTEERLPQTGIVSLAIRRSHHIGCLQAYLQRATQKNKVLILLSSDPSCASVAAHGGLSPVYTPNPIALGIPTHGDPILIDISASTTSNGLTMRLHKEGRPLAGPWVQDAKGQVTNDPGVLFSEQPGTLLPLGGKDLGHKGFALGIMVEMFTSALAGFGRAEKPTRWGANVFMQLIDPDFFGGVEHFLRETTFLAQLCQGSAVPPGNANVRMPGENGLKKRAEQLAQGVRLYPGILEDLEIWAQKWDVQVPNPC